jgi:predicted Zn-dependent protease
MKRNIVFLILILLSPWLCGQGRYDAMLKAAALSGAGHGEEAAAVLSDAISGGRDADLLLLRGEILLKSGRLKEAANDFMTAENIRQGSGIYGLARCAASGGDARAAAAYLEIYLKSPVRRSEPEIMLDSSFAPIASSPEWKALWKKDWYKGYERKAWEINNYITAGRTDLAEETWRDLSALYTDMPVTEYCRARIMMSKGQYREAAGILSELTAGKEAPVSWLLALAEARAGEGSWYAAATVYGRLMAEEYPDPSLLLRRARMLLKAGDRNAARSDLEKYLSLDPDNSEALGLTGRIFAEEGAIYEALPYLNANIDKHPGEAKAFSLRGDAWLAARTWDKAEDDYTMSLDLDPDDARVNLNLGIALINSGRTDDACHYLRRAKALGDKDAAQYLAKYCIR